MMFSTLKRIFLPLLVLGLLALPAAATIVRSLTLADMTRQADVVVQATVERQTMSWNDEKTRIYTLTELRVVDPIKGAVQTGEVIQVRQLGGTVDGLTQSIAGNAKLRATEEVILFLDRDPEKPLHYVVGMAQGKFAVDRTGPAPVVVRDLHGLAMAEVKDSRIAKISETPQPAAATAPALDAFKQQIRAAMQP